MGIVYKLSSNRVPKIGIEASDNFEHYILTNLGSQMTYFRNIQAGFNKDYLGIALH